MVETTQPPISHWAFFLPQPADDEIGTDGIVKRGGFLPAITLPRRMFAACDIAFESPLRLGIEAQMVTKIAAVTHKRGRSGDLVFVEVARVITQDSLICVRERQSYVYRGIDEPAVLPPPAKTEIPGEIWSPDSVNLFRFSAVTFNSHRIHYDLPYTRDEEGYPALLVHGPFVAVKLAALAGRRAPLVHFSFRAQAPLFLGQSIILQEVDSEVRAVRCDGTLAMTARPTYR